LEDIALASISIQGLTKTFPNGTKALDGINLEIGRSEMVALIGASGSGKSTLIRHIAGLVVADSSSVSSVKIDDRSIQSGGQIASEVRQLRRNIGVIFQQFNLVNRMSVLTNVLTGRLGQMPVINGVLGFFSLADQQRAMLALERVGIAKMARQRASTLSGGQQQRAAIARALVQGAKVLLADEPIASLDPAAARRVMESLVGINRNDGITILVSLHQVEYARRFCARTIAMQAGRVVFDGPSVLLTNERLEEIYGSASEELVLPDAADLNGLVAVAA
jgi:phosphonate transport system ATP-binding protein